jgi:hypothetical protein
VLYDGVLGLDLPEGLRLIAFADDLAVLVTAKTEQELMSLAMQCPGESSSLDGEDRSEAGCPKDGSRPAGRKKETRRREISSRR